VTIAVNAVNDGPVAVDDELSTAEDTALTIGVDDLFGADGTGPANDYDLDSANFSSITVTGLASNGTLYLDGVAVVQGQEILVSEIASGKLSFEPVADFNGDAAFRYTVSDGVLSSGEATVTIAVNAVNDFPSAGVVSILVDEDGLLSGNHDAAYGDDVAVDDQGTPLAVETIATGTLDFSYGPEGPGDIDFTALDGTTAGFTSGGAAVTYSWDGNTHTLTAATSTATVFELVLAVDGLANPSGGYTFTLLGPVDHGDSGTEDNITVTLPFAVTDSDSDIASGSINVTIDDDMPVLSIADHGIIRNHDSSAVNSVSASITGDLGIDAGADGIGSLVIDFAGAHINGEILSQLTSSGSQVAVVSDGNGGLVGKLGDGTDIFTLTANPDGTYTFNLLGHLDVYSQQEFTLDSRSIAGGPADVLYLNTDAGIKMNVEGSSWVARVTGSDRLNPGGSGIGVRDNNFSDGDSITIDLDDENADPAAAATDIVASMKLGFKDFTAADTGGVGWTALWVAAAGDATPVATTSGTLYFSDGVLNSDGALEFAIGPNNGYTLDSIQITAADGTQVKLSTVTLFSANETGTATLDFNYTATDGDGDASTGSFSVVVDGGGGTGTVNGTTGDDVIGGSVQADILAGGDGDDILVGGGGDDILVGGAGNDQLLGGPGGDVMTGGTGSDTFIWQSGESGTDTITDFNPGEGDVLNIADLLVGVNNPSAGELDGSYLSIASGASTTITIFGDSGNADQVIQLTGYDTTGLSGVEILNNLLAGSNLVVE
jgi:T1SS-143 domain-containing protein